MSRLQNILCAELRRQLESKTLTAPRIPAGGELLWRWFMDLHKSRTLHAAGANPISYAEIQSYASLMRWPIEPRHVMILRAMDETYLKASVMPQASAPEGVKTLPPVSSAPVTSALIDAMFG